MPWTFHFTFNKYRRHDMKWKLVDWYPYGATSWTAVKTVKRLWPSAYVDRTFSPTVAVLCLDVPNPDVVLSHIEASGQYVTPFFIHNLTCHKGT